MQGTIGLLLLHINLGLGIKFLFCFLWLNGKVVKQSTLGNKSHWFWAKTLWNKILMGMWIQGKLIIASYMPRLCLNTFFTTLLVECIKYFTNLYWTRREWLFLDLLDYNYCFWQLNNSLQRYATLIILAST